jgi:hypothetical protein
MIVNKPQKRENPCNSTAAITDIENMLSCVAAV